MSVYIPADCLEEELRFSLWRILAYEILFYIYHDIRTLAHILINQESKCNAKCLKLHGNSWRR